MATIKIQDFKIGFTDQFFFDTNVWLLLFGTIADFQSSDQKKYSKLLEDLITKDNPIFISSIIISEYANVLLRRNYNQWLSIEKIANAKFKVNFVGSKEYKNSVDVITKSVSKILSLPNVQSIPDSFHCININSVLENFKSIDFNDAYIFELSKLNNYKIVTNDKDFQELDSKIDIITS
ncbi:MULTISPECIES: PIN domain-containing protein [Flavobacterium]|uniref:PIN domain-containing protein n=1 Tax=Flavobacterium TaxID=237 RepID=UPI002115AA47|nr:MULTISPECIES: PIN domain-containing protein [Flavobacterium]UUF14358.1 PIN domain-containing protein [Flavobacterium panici]